MTDRIKQWHIKEAEKLARQLPENIDDAISILEAISYIVEKAVTEVINDVMPTMTLQ